MRKMLLLITTFVSIAGFAAVASASCDTQCRSDAMGVGEGAARKVVFAEIMQGGKLGRLIRAEVGLEVCGSKGKSAAVAKLRRARLDEVIGKRLRAGPLGQGDANDERGAIEFASFLSTVQALQMGYAMGYEEMAMSAADDKSMRGAMCKAYDKLGDSVLFGDG